MIPWTVVHEIFQARTLEWVAISFPSGSSQYVSDEDHLPGSQTIILSSHGKDREREEEREKAGRKEEGKGSKETVRKEEGEALSKKELRQQRAAERAKIAPQVKELKRRVETAEAKIDELQKRLEEVSAELFNPKPDTDFAEANRQVRTLQFEIDRYTADWEEAATELERLQQGA